MSVTTALAVYIVIWWVVLFAVLPFGVRSQHETGDIVPGSDPGAPALPRLGWKLLWTTLIAAAVFAVLVALRRAGFGLDDIPFMPRPG